VPIFWKFWEPQLPETTKGLSRSVIGKVRNYREWEEETVDRAVLRTRFEISYGRVARQTAQ